MRLCQILSRLLVLLILLTAVVTYADESSPQAEPLPPDLQDLGHDALAELAFDDLANYQQALDRQGPSRAARQKLAVAWIKASGQWRQCDPVQLRHLIDWLNAGPLSEADDPIHVQVIGHAKTRYLFDDAFINTKESKSVIFKLARSVAFSLEQAERAQLGDELVNHYVNKTQNLATLSTVDVMELQLTLSACSVGTEQPEPLAVAAWLEASERWHEAEPGDLYLLLHLLKPFGSDQKALSAQKALVEHASDVYLGDSSRWGNVNQKENLFILVSELKDHVAVSQRRQVAGALRQFFVEDRQQLSGLSQRDVRQLGRALAVLTDRAIDEQIAAVLSSWLVSSDQWQQWPALEIGATVRWLRSHNPGATASVRRQMAAHVLPQLTTAVNDINENNNVLILHDIVAELSAQDKASLRQLLVQRVQEDARLWRFQVGQRELLTPKLIRSTLEQLGSTEEQIQSLDLVATAVWAQPTSFPPEVTLRATPSEFHFYIAYYFYDLRLLDGISRDEIVRSLRQRLARSQEVHPLAVKIISYPDSYNAPDSPKTWTRQDELEAWLAFLEDKAAEPSLTGDQRAGWLLARAYAAETTEPRRLMPLYGKWWIDQALAEAESEQMQLSCVRWLVQGHAALDQFEKALSILESVEHQFSSTSAQQTFSSLRDQVALAEQGTVRRAELAASHAQATRRRELERRLAKARERSDREQITSLERLLSRPDPPVSTIAHRRR